MVWLGFEGATKVQTADMCASYLPQEPCAPLAPEELMRRSHGQLPRAHFPLCQQVKQTLHARAVLEHERHEAAEAAQPLLRARG